MSVIAPVKPSFLGRGFAFPFRLDDTQMKPAFTSDEERVKESISAIINTGVHERPFLVRNGVPYGTRFRGLLFSNAQAAADVAKYDAKVVLGAWEPRIAVLEVTADINYIFAEGTIRGMLLNILYRYRSTNRIDNYVRPYRTTPYDSNGSR
jgi:phage baseplate assembly protein W